jgi:protein-tyrosine phosphatase
MAGYTRLVQVLFVCTANMCRSPMAAALFGRLALVGGDDAPEEVTVASAGLLQGGYGSPPEVVTAMAEVGIDLSRHRSTQISPELVAASDVVLAMGRRHAREVVLLDGRAWDRTFTLKEFVRRGETVGGRGPDEALGSWLGRLHRGRQRTDLVGNAPADDVADPIGGPLAGYRKTARELGALVDEAASLLWVRRGIRTLPG